MLANARVRAVLPVVDFKRARTFYKEKLGLQLFDEPGPGEAVYACGQGTQLALYQRDTGTKADHTVAEFRVNNVKDAVQALREKGVVFEQYPTTDEQGIATMGRIKAAWFKDTENNILAVVQIG